MTRILLIPLMALMGLLISCSDEAADDWKQTTSGWHGKIETGQEYSCLTLKLTGSKGSHFWAAAIVDPLDTSDLSAWGSNVSLSGEITSGAQMQFCFKDKLLEDQKYGHLLIIDNTGKTLALLPITDGNTEALLASFKIPSN